MLASYRYAGPLYWITNRRVDELKDEEFQRFENACEEFVDIFEEEGKLIPSVYNSTIYRADITRSRKVGKF